MADELSLQLILSSWAGYGLALFIRITEIDSPACQQLLAEQEKLQAADPQIDTNMLSEHWPDFCNWVQDEIRSDTSPMNQLCMHFELDLAELFLLALKA